jgi:ABC-2 type transport system ATP-binding protein
LVQVLGSFRLTDLVLDEPDLEEAVLKMYAGKEDTP